MAGRPGHGTGWLARCRSGPVETCRFSRAPRTAAESTGPDGPGSLPGAGRWPGNPPRQALLKGRVWPRDGTSGAPTIKPASAGSGLKSIMGWPAADIIRAADARDPSVRGADGKNPSQRAPPLTFCPGGARFGLPYGKRELNRRHGPRRYVVARSRTAIWAPTAERPVAIHDYVRREDQNAFRAGKPTRRRGSHGHRWPDA